MKKTYVLDTNVILYSSGALLSFGNNDVVIPEVVLEELDDFKKNKTDLGLNARQASRIIDGLRKLGNLNEGVPLPGGGKLRIETNCLNAEVPKFWDRNKADNRILQVCKALKDAGEDVILITKDTFERIKADIVNVKSEDFYEKVVPAGDEQYTGRMEVYVSQDKLSEFYSKKVISKNDVVCYQEENDEYYTPTLYTNQFLVMHSLENKKQSALGRFDGENIVHLHYKDSKPLGLSARNVGQRFMLECLFTSSNMAPLSIVKGPAGTAKTLFSLAVGLQKIIEEETGEYRKILVCRPNVTMDEEIGFLPGTEEQKISPFMRPIFDNLEVLVDSDEKERYKNEKELQDKVNELFDRRIITTEAIAYLRGRSIIRQWVIIDEAQDYSPLQYEIFNQLFNKANKTILGDISQSINPYMNVRSYNNVVNILKPEDTSIINLTKSYRSTMEITKFSRKILSDEIQDEYVERSGEWPKLTGLLDEEDINERIVEEVKVHKGDGHNSIGIITKNVDEAQRVYNHLKDRINIKMIISEDDEYVNDILVIPAYLAKGLEFDVVMIYNASDLKYKDEEDRLLLYTACTRALHVLDIFYLRNVSSLLK